jgi:squalene-hopene/tetraprenyl-beta-curcumene cyclase
MTLRPCWNVRSGGAATCDDKGRGAFRDMCARVIVLLAAGAGIGFCGEWNPKLAAAYLDSRQQAWLAWPTAIHGGVACISCHTNMTYLLARPALSRALHQSGPSPYEAKLLDSLRSGLARKTPAESPALGVESVLAALLLASEDARRGMPSAETGQALDRMWALQITAETNKGAWHWFSLDLDPWEEPESAFYGAALAALAVGMAPGDYASRPEIQGNLESLKAYLTAQQASQPAHNRLVLMWAAARWPGLLSAADRNSIAQSVLAKQQDDGGWTLEALGPWKQHSNAAPGGGSNAYATGWASFTLRQAGVLQSDSRMRRALDWLRRHQDAATGSWAAESMNKRYEPDFMQSQFMRDAATGFASMALLAGQ